jgi:putative MATE family efflux protein
MNISGVFFMIVLANGYLGFKNYGYLGAALGNGISYLVGGVCIIVAWVSGLLSVRPKNYLGINFSQIKEILFVGYPAALEQVVFQFGITAFLILVSYYGTDAYAAYGIGVQILSFSFVIGFGFSIAGATLVGQHLGALDVNQARRSGWGAMRLSIISMSLFGLLISLFAEPLAYFMINDESVVRLTVLFIWLLGSMQPFMAIEFSLGGALRGAGDTKTPLMITLTCLVLIRVSLAGLFFYLSLPVEYIFASLLADYIVKGFLYTYSFRSGKWVNAIKLT